MDATSPMSADLQRQQDRKRKRKAILAGGVVLGLGAAVTLAAWSDDVFADGVFNTGTIELEGNITANADVTNTTAGWGTYDGPDAVPTGDTGELAFASRPQTLVPFEPVYAPIALRLSNDTTIDATDIVLNSIEIGAAPGPQALDGNLTYTVYTGVAATDCTATDMESETTTITDTVNATPGTSVDYTTTPSALLAPSTDNSQGILELCLGIELNSNEDDVKGVDDTTVTWRFTAETD